MASNLLIPEVLSFASLIIIILYSPVMDFYLSTFLFLISICAFLSYKQYQTSRSISAERKPLLTEPANDENEPVPDSPSVSRSEVTRFRWLFLTVYALVMGSDWLQGPYIYSLYKDQVGLPESTVALLFTTGFLSAGISGYFVGQFADRHGRKLACLLFCIIYSGACFATLSQNLYVLFLGRVFGGVSTSLLYCVFESWMVTEYHGRGLEGKGESLSKLFGYMATLNSVMAILAGVFSEWIVDVTGTKRAPFMASASLLSIAFVFIQLFWTEDYGNTHQEKSSTTTRTDTNEPPRQNIFKTILTSPQILTLGLASCIFEGSMYLFVFFWTPFLTFPSPQSLPLGLIFASFMSCTTIGSLLFTLLRSHSPILPLTFLLSASSLTLSLLTHSPHAIFLSFCIYEVCVGVYWPSIGVLKGRLVEDGVRARVYGLLRVPLNAFVVVALALVRDGEAFRRAVFQTCAGMLVGTSIVVFAVISAP